jgi:tetratricopeptide (TPR) repeat protein
MSAFQNAVDLDPFNPETYSNMGDVYRLINHSLDALSIYREAALRNPQDRSYQQKIQHLLRIPRRYEYL